MSVTNRKMFSRNARNRLRNMGGIMASSEPLIQAVAKFNVGGGVNFGALEQRYTGTPGIKRLRSEVDGPGVKTIQSQQAPLFSFGQTKQNIFGQNYNVFQPGLTEPKNVSRLSGQNFQTQKAFDLTREELLGRQKLNNLIGKAESLGFLEKPTVSKTEVEEFIRNETDTPFFEASEALINALSQPAEPGEDTSKRNLGIFARELAKYTLLPGTVTADVLKKTGEFILKTNPKRVEGILSGQISMPEGVDIIALGASSGLSETRLKELGVPIDKINAMKKVRAEGLGNLERKVTLFDDQAKAAEDEEEKLRKDTAAAKLTMQEAEREAEQIAMREAEKKKAVEGGMPLSNQVGATDVKALQNQISGGRSSIDRQTLGVSPDEGTEYKHALETEKYRNGQNSNIEKTVQDTVNSGIGTGGALKQLMKEFTSNSPKYEGMDRGLAIAKIGFAMAAGQSPNAITNIAKALSDGADMFLQDDAERRRFKRQVDLSALQYGLGEISKQRTQARADARNFMKYVATKDMEYKGVKYEEGEDVLVSMSDLLANGGRLPSGLRDQALHLKFTQAVIEKEKANAKALENLRKELLISDEQATKMSKDYQDAASKFKSADTGIAYFEQALDILAKEGAEGWHQSAVGAAGLLKNVRYKAGNFLGIELGKQYDLDDVEELKRLFAQGLQPLIKVTLGETQSANSISNRDVEFLIKAFFGDRALEEGVFNFVVSDNNEMAKRVQAAMRSMRQAQIGNLNTMNTLERRLSTRILPGEEVGSGVALIKEAKTGVSSYLPGATNQVNPGGFGEIFDKVRPNGKNPIKRHQ